MTHSITSTQNPRIKSAAQLRDRRGREQQGRIVIDGSREIARALDAGVELIELYVGAEHCSAAEQDLIRRSAACAAAVFTVPPAVFAKLAYGDHTEGLVAVARTPQRSLADLPVAVDTLVVVLAGVEKPGNVGAVLRTADAAGATGAIVADGGTDLYNPNAIRASLGAIFTVPVCAVSSAEALAWLRRHGYQILAARVDGAVEYSAVSYRRPCAIVLGSEAQGLSDEWQGDGITAVRLPMHGRVDSLNVSATAAVLLYEAAKPR